MIHPSPIMQCFWLPTFYDQLGAGEVAEVNHLNGRGKTKRSEPNYESLLKNVKPHILEKILKIYYLDFILFGYSTAQFEADMQAMFFKVEVIGKSDNTYILKFLLIIHH